MTNQNNEAGEKLLRPDAVCELLDINRQTLTAWLEEGYGPPVIRLPKKGIRFRRKDVEAWLADSTEKGGAAK